LLVLAYRLPGRIWFGAFMRRDGLLEHAPDRRASGGRSGERVAGGIEALLVWNNKGTFPSRGC